MFPRENGLTLTTIWVDEYVFEVACQCSNGWFSGQTEFYLAEDELSRLSDTLRGFPSNPDDKRQVSLGTTGVLSTDGSVLMTFYCVDSKGHCAVKISLERGTYKREKKNESVVLHVPIEPGAIDTFLDELAGLETMIDASAHLPMAT